MSNQEHKPQQCVFTVVANNYLPFARTLMRSVKEFSPELSRVVFLCDREAQENQSLYDSVHDEFELVQVEQLGIDDFPRMAFSYSLVELCTAIKPFCFKHLHGEGHQEIAYLDPDIRTYAPMDAVFNLLKVNNIVLTPHLTRPITDDKRPNEVDILRAGVYNLGFLAINASTESKKFIDWWASKLRHQCIAAPDKGLFVDQRWIDLVPSFFNGVHISKHPGMNVAYWNLTDRDISSSGSTLYSNNEPLIFVHYSGINPHNGSFSRHQNRHQMQTLPTLFGELTNDYIDELVACGAREKRKPDYAYAKLHNEERVSDLAKSMYASLSGELPIKMVALDNEAFSAMFIDLINKPAENPFDGTTNYLITAIAYKVYRSREDLQYRFPNIFNSDAEPFIQWLLLSTDQSNLIPERCRTFLQSQLDKSAGSKIITRPSLVSQLYHRSPFIKRCVLKFTSKKTRQKILRFFDNKR